MPLNFDGMISSSVVSARMMVRDEAFFHADHVGDNHGRHCLVVGAPLPEMPIFLDEQRDRAPSLALRLDNIGCDSNVVFAPLPQSATGPLRTSGGTMTLMSSAVCRRPWQRASLPAGRPGRVTAESVVLISTSSW
jgi:hypothetical protein